MPTCLERVLFSTMGLFAVEFEILVLGLVLNISHEIG